MSAATAAGMSAATAAAVTAAAAVTTASRGNSNTLAKRGLVFFIEDVECGHADIGDFLLSQYDIFARYGAPMRHVCRG
jgi:hypothetical protein